MAADGFGTKNQPTFLNTGAPDIAVDPTLVSNYAALVGNTKVLTTVQRNALAGLDVWEGLHVTDTTDNLLYRRVAGAWVIAGGIAATGTIAADGNQTIAYSKVVRDPFGRVNAEWQANRINTTTYAASLILGFLPVGFRPTNDTSGLVITYGTGSPNQSVITAATGQVTLLTASPAGHTAARCTVSFLIT